MKTLLNAITRKRIELMMEELDPKHCYLGHKLKQQLKEEAFDFFRYSGPSQDGSITYEGLRIHWVLDEPEHFNVTP